MLVGSRLFLVRCLRWRMGIQRGKKYRERIKREGGMKSGGEVGLEKGSSAKDYFRRIQRDSGLR